MEGIWKRGIKPLAFEPLRRSANTEVLIIGGGLAGLLCSHMLRCKGVDHILLEANRICGGITENTTAKITLQHGLCYNKLIKQFGEEKACLYAEAQKLAGENYEALANHIPCDYEKKDSYVYSLHDPKRIRREAEAMERLGIRAELMEALPLPFPVAAGVCVRNQAQFHPLKFAYALAKDLPIYESTKVIELMPHRAVTPYGEIRCKKMIVATHFPILNQHGSYFLKLYQHRSYVLALRGAPQIDGMFVDESDKGLSFRTYRDLLILGGGGHRTGKQGEGWRELEAFVRNHYKSAEIVGKWATQDCMSLDSVPYIGQYSKNTPHMFVATGFNKWGMTSSMVAALVLSDLVLGKENPYAPVFSPSRSIFLPQLAINGFESMIGLLTPTVPRCPHLGCALKYNKAEHSWDCPCHGSRFTTEGELINNPATDDKKNMPPQP